MKEKSLFLHEDNYVISLNVDKYCHVITHPQNIFHNIFNITKN